MNSFPGARRPLYTASALLLTSTTFLYSPEAMANICFLADTACQEGSFLPQYDAPTEITCNEGTLNKLCELSHRYIITCHDNRGTHYKPTDCNYEGAGYCDMKSTHPDHNNIAHTPIHNTPLGDRYACRDTQATNCQDCCLPEDIYCQSDFHFCKNNSVPKNKNEYCIEGISKACAAPTSPETDKKYRKCICVAPYTIKSTSCPSPLKHDGECIGDEGTYYDSCYCPSGYSELSTLYRCQDNSTCYKSTSYPGVLSPKLPTNGNYCVSPNYYSCIPYTCSDGGYYSSEPTNYTCQTVSYHCNTCYTNCRRLTCADGGYETSETPGMECSSVTYAGNTCYTCSTPTPPINPLTSCEDQGYYSEDKGEGWNCTDIGGCYDCSAKTCGSYGYESSACNTETHNQTVHNDVKTGDSTSTCYTCVIKGCEETCTWNASNKGTATISDLCCDGNYRNCTSDCVEVTVPANAHSTGTCKGCGVTVNTDWECDAGYKKSGDSCVAKTCADYGTGYQEDECPAGKVQTEIPDCALGSIDVSCYYCSDAPCVATTCEAQGYKDSCNECQNAEEHIVTSCPSNLTCYTCTDKSKDAVKPAGYQSNTCDDTACYKESSSDICGYTFYQCTKKAKSEVQAPDGYQADTCTAPKVTDQTRDKCGYTFYTCKDAPKCSDGGYYDADKGDGWTCTTKTYEGKTCYQCTANTCDTYGYQSSTCGSSYDQTTHSNVKTGDTTATCYECKEKKSCPAGYYETESACTSAHPNCSCSLDTESGCYQKVSSCSECTNPPCEEEENQSDDSCCYDCFNTYHAGGSEDLWEQMEQCQAGCGCNCNFQDHCWGGGTSCTSLGYYSSDLSEEDSWYSIVCSKVSGTSCYTCQCQHNCETFCYDCDQWGNDCDRCNSCLKEVISYNGFACYGADGI